VRQLEIAKIDEAKEGVPVQIIDIAIPAEIRSLPQRTKMVTIAALIGLCGGVTLAFLRGAIRALGRNKERQARLQVFRRSWALR
jgi:uncharacterized protein involved in exopolysaccharide biosynthesis